MNFQSLFKKEDGIKIGKIKGLPFKREVLTDSELNHHVHVVGASGFGKSVLISHMVKNRIAKGHGLIYIDLKGDRETIQDFKNYALFNGHLKNIELFSLTPGFSMNGFNPIIDGTPTQIRDRIMKSFTWSEEFYRNLASSFLLKLLIIFCYLRDERRFQFKFSFSTVLDVLTKRNQFFDFVRDQSTAKPEIKVMAQELYSFLSEKNNEAGLQGLKTQVESLVLSDFGTSLEGRSAGINFFETVRDGNICFIYLDTRRYGESAKTIGKLILENLKSASARIDAEVAQDRRKATSVIIDEFSDLASEDFISFLDRARSSKISVTVAHQEMADLRRISPEFAARLSGNTATVYAFLQKVPESAELISGMAGTRTVWKTTKQTERLWFFEIDSQKGSKREVEEFNIHPNLVKSLPVGSCVCIKKYPSARSYLVRVDRGH